MVSDTRHLLRDPPRVICDAHPKSNWVRFGPFFPFDKDCGTNKAKWFQEKANRHHLVVIMARMSLTEMAVSPVRAQAKRRESAGLLMM
ncbi:MAG: hypothetical protein AAF697_02545 [Pseudomonadota bacterium]